MEPIRIPIAEDCTSTFYLTERNLRFESYIFDWLIISPQTSCQLIKTDFNNFFKKENLVPVGKGTTMFKRAGINVHDVFNDIIYIHHFNDIEIDFLPLKDKFERKINRMNAHFKNNRKIEFYYKSTTYQDWKNITKQVWGVDAMNNEFVDLKKFILEKYSYCDENDIKLIIL